MSFAGFIIKLEADAKGVEKGVNVAQNHFKRLGTTVKEIEGRATKEREKQQKLAVERLKPEERLNSLLKTREQILGRIARVEDPRTKNLYLQKQVELEKQIAAARTVAARAPFKAAGRLAGGIALGAGVVGAGVNLAASNANELQDASLTSGLSLNALQKLQSGADATGTSFTGLTSAAKSVRVAQSAALNGNTKMLKAFEQAGIGQSDLRSMSSEDIFFRLAQGGANVGNVSALTKIFGEGSSDEVIKAFGNGLGEAAGRMDRFNLLMDDSMIEALADFKSGLQGSAATIKQLGRRALGGLAGGFMRLGKRAKSVGALFTGGLDSAGDLQARADLIGDSDYGDSLAETKRLQGRLDLARQRRELEQAGSQDELEADYNEWKYMRKVKDKKSSTGTLGSGNHIDSDELARIGLYRGGTDAGRLLQDQYKELQAIKRELEDIRRGMDE